MYYAKRLVIIVTCRTELQHFSLVCLNSNLPYVHPRGEEVAKVPYHIEKGGRGGSILSLKVNSIYDVS